MDEPLFISSSERSLDADRAARSSVALTLLVVLGVLLACEVALRATGWPKEVPYELGGEEYNAVAGVMNRNDLPDVMIVGSSRAREAVALPMLQELLSTRAGRPIRVGSCATSGALASDVDAIVSRALRTRKPPRIILYGIAERDLNLSSPMFDQATRFWDFDDWRDASSAGLKRTLPELATVVRNEAGRHLRILGEREQIRLTLRQRLTRSFLGARDTLLYGKLTDWQKGSPRRSLATRPARKDRIDQNVRSFQRNVYPNGNLRDCLERLIARCEETRTQLVLFEVPPSRVIRRALPKEVNPRFLQTVTELTEDKRNVKFLTATQLELYFNDRHYREMAHLNLNGATLLTQKLTDAIYPAKRKKKPSTNPATAPASAQ